MQISLTRSLGLLLLPLGVAVLVTTSQGLAAPTAPTAPTAGAGVAGNGGQQTLLIIDGHLRDVTGTLDLKLTGPGDPLAGASSTVATAYAGQVLYQSFERTAAFPAAAAQPIGTPPTPTPPGTVLARMSLRSVDLSNGRDRLLVAGAHTFAIGRDGRLGYIRGDGAIRMQEAPAGQVYVQPANAGRAVAWTEKRHADRILAWAGDTLLVERHVAGRETGGLILALDGPGKARVLAPAAEYLAVSPDGSRALLDIGGAMDPADLAVVDIATGRRVSTIDLAALGSDRSIRPVAASWTADRIVLSTFARRPDGAGHSVLISAGVGRTQTTIERGFRFPFQQRPAFGRPFGAAGTVFHAVTTDGVVRDSTSQNHYLLESCDIASGRCTETDLGVPAGGHAVSTVGMAG